jgi:hypothetical protein
MCLLFPPSEQRVVPWTLLGGNRQPAGIDRRDQTIKKFAAFLLELCSAILYQTPLIMTQIVNIANRLNSWHVYSVNELANCRSHVI